MASAAPRKIDTVIFDCGGVILTGVQKDVYNTQMAEVAAAVGLPSGPDLKKRVYTNGPEWPLAKVGKMTGTEMFTQIFNSYGVTDPATIKRYADVVRIAGRGVHPKMAALLGELRARGIRVGMLSNYDTDLRAVLAVNGLGDADFDPLLNSAEIGVAKPDPQSFAKMLAAAGKTAEQGAEVIFVDDKPRNTEAAKEFGVPHSIVYTGIDQCYADVMALIDGKEVSSVHPSCAEEAGEPASPL